MYKIEIKSKSIFTRGNKRRCLYCREVVVGIYLDTLKYYWEHVMYKSLKSVF